MAEEENEKDDFYNAVQSLSSITDETTRTQLAEILVKKEMKKKIRYVVSFNSHTGSFILKCTKQKL